MSKARKLADLLDSAGDVAGGKIADDTINSEHFVDGGIDDAHIGDVAATKLTGTIASGRLSASNMGSGTIPDARFPATLPSISGANITALNAASLTGNVADARIPALTASKLTGALPAIDGSNLTGVATDTSVIENNIALLAFYRATDHSKEKYSLVDQVIDDYNDASGVDAGASTNESLTSGVYKGQTSSTGNATGGTTSTTGGYEYHLFKATTHDATNSVNFVTPGTGTIDYLIVGGGGSGRSTHAGTPAGGGGGSHQLFTGQSKTAATYAIVTGGGGSGWTSVNNGQASTAFGTTKAGGSYGNTTGHGHAGTQYSQFSQFGRTNTNTETGTRGYFAGGGAGPCGDGKHGGASGGCGAGGHQWNDGLPDGPADWGGGGGGGSAQANASGPGGHGCVIIRYLTNAFTTLAVGDLTLQSTANTAESAPATGDMVTLIEDAAGTATINTDIKGYISRDGGSNWTQGTLTDEGDWGTNKRILAFHNLDISSQPSGTSMKYKITTHNQSGSKETRIHATSLAWA